MGQEDSVGSVAHVQAKKQKIVPCEHHNETTRNKMDLHSWSRTPHERSGSTAPILVVLWPFGMKNIERACVAKETQNIQRADNFNLGCFVAACISQHKVHCCLN